MGRKTSFTYAANGIDLLTTANTTNGTQLLETRTYNSAAPAADDHRHERDDLPIPVQRGGAGDSLHGSAGARHDLRL